MLVSREETKRLRGCFVKKIALRARSALLSGYVPYLVCKLVRRRYLAGYDWHGAQHPIRASGHSGHVRMRIMPMRIMGKLGVATEDLTARVTTLLFK